ncbi:MAG TPA: ferredoxin reductase, partial [Holosporales bacterium]|nr:ferredoxin reductase [Holosporales bacterium]
MVTLTYKNQKIPLQDGQSVLDAILEGGLSVPHACKQGVCQSCLLKATEGEIPPAAQIG